MIYECKKGVFGSDYFTLQDKLQFALASSLSLDDKPDEGVYDQVRNYQ